MSGVSAPSGAAGWLGIALANVVAVLGPDRIVVGGGIARGRVGARSDRGRRRAGDLGAHRPHRGGGGLLGSYAGAIGAALAGIEAEQTQRVRSR